MFTLFRKNAVVHIDVKDSDDLADIANIPDLTDKLPAEQIEKLPFGLGDKLKDAAGSGNCYKFYLVILIIYKYVFI